MEDGRFRKRLAQELPRWQEKGWITAEAGIAMLEDVGIRHPKVVWASSLALLGALLLGVGVITWFAAHWAEMSKLSKLVLIFLALIGSHVAHGACLGRHDLPKLADALSFLSVLFFGAAIMLIGQIYHIDAHFPDGIALWSVGGLLTAWLLASQPALMASLVLAAVWTWSEQFEYRAMNWVLLAYLGFTAILLIQRNWKIATRVWGLLFLLWIAGWHAQSWIGDHWDGQNHIRLFALQLLGIAGLWSLAQSSRHPFAEAVRNDFLLALLIGIFLFTFPEISSQRSTGNNGGLIPWIAAFSGLAILFLLAVGRLLRHSQISRRRRALALVLSSTFVVLVGAELLFAPKSGLIALVWNGLFLGVIFWINDLGIRHRDRLVVNRAFAAFAIWVLARYFDAFWSLLDRSLFFMAGGVLLLAGGALLERGRRKLIHDIADHPA